MGIAYYSDINLNECRNLMTIPGAPQDFINKYFIILNIFLRPIP